ncbi:MAG: bifunctional 5,10-methylenetetrahydrofolate dehydrogenase/5,10-methenyltetrahydrofolate cyclohydrolase [Firmicutes bacterium]|nr:bifunctional 5,10-methylenetetrahydrofolate dehydrogenase/5,10-methenyltetrahydrofolate cyclohydrolase [Bacillota bacterium]
MAELLKGAAVAKAMTAELAERAEALKAKGVEPCLAILRVGENPSDISYETGALKRMEKVGVKVKQILLPADASKEAILDAVKSVNEDSSIHGLLMFRPLANKEAEAEACKLIDPAKDVDAMSQTSLASVFTGSGEGYAPCTAQSCMEILDYYKVPIQGKRAVVIGRSLVIGKPVSQMLMAKNATVTVCHSRSVDIPGICKEADIVIAALGKAKFMTADFAKEGQTIIDVGINVNEEGKLCGDVDFDNVEPIVAGITPVPGGVGNVTTAVLAKHVIEAAEKTL